MAKTLEELLDLTLKEKCLEKKLEYCAKYLELNPNDRDVWNYKGNVLDLLGRSTEAIRCFTKACEGTSVDYKAAILTLDDKSAERSVRFFDAVLREELDCAMAWLGKGRALLILERCEESIVCFDKAPKVKKSKVVEAEAWLWKGSALKDLKRLEEALTCFNNSLEIDPSNVKAWLFKGILFVNKMKKYEEALICFNEVLEILKTNPDNEIAKMAKDGKEFAERRLKERAKSNGLFKRLFG